MHNETQNTRYKPRKNPEKSKNIHVEYRAKTAKNIDHQKTIHITQKKEKHSTNPYKPRQAQTEQTTHTKGALCEKQHNTV